MRRAVLLAALSGLALASVAAGEGGPPFYVKKGTWQETVRASLEALVRQEAEETAARTAGSTRHLKGFEPFAAQLTAQGGAVRVRVKVGGLKTLCLRVRNLKASRRGRGTACFGNPRLLAADGKATPLTLRRPLFVAVYGNRHVRDERDRRWEAVRTVGRTPRSEPTVGGGRAEDDLDLELEEDPVVSKNRFERGLMVQKDSELVFRLDGKFERFEAWARLHPGESAAGDTAQLMVDNRSHIAARERADADRKTVWDLTRRDFAGAHVAREQGLEQRARIWDQPWTPGDVAALASRYARGCSSDVRKAANELAKAATTPTDLAAVRGLFYLRDTREHVDFARKTLELVERRAPRPKLAAEVAEIEKLLERAAQEPARDWSSLHRRTVGLRRRILFSHPALAFDKLLINKRPLARYNHMCDQYLGRHSGIGAGLVVLENWKESPKETLLLEGKLPPGCTRRPELSFDGTRILFSFCDHTAKRADHRRFWIYEIGADGSGLRQLTGTPDDPCEGWGGRATVLIEDWDPCYLPDGGFAFITTRSQSFGRCHGSRYVPTYMVYRANADGSGIRQLSFGEANEWDPAVLQDGRIIYTRWDYINRHDTIFQSLWVMRPDGTGTAHFYGNYSRSPCMIAEAQAIPGSHKVVATGTDHHGRSSGTIIVIDPRLGQEEGAPVTWITPELGFPESGVPRGITMTPRPRHQRGRRAATPWPLTEDLFFVAYQEEAHYAIYLIDTLGGRELIYADPTISCFAPTPIRPRPMPPALQSAVAATRDSKTGVFYVQAVHTSTQPLAPGSIKRLRINRIYGQPTRSKPRLSLANNEIIKGILGTVPVNADGSAAFRAPAGVPLQFQALDEHGMALMTMRSLVYLQPGETVNCVGCHENRMDAPPHNYVPPTVTVHAITPPAGPRYEGGFSFVRTVQPVLDRYCIRCHGLAKTEGQLCLLGTRAGSYNKAHDSLTSRSGCVAIAYRNRETAYSKPKDYFAHAGKLAKVITEKHAKRVTLDRDSLQRIIDWLDLNAQFYGDYSHNRIENARPTGDGEKALRKHIAETFGEELAKQPFEALVNIALPTESRILNAPLAAGAGGWGQIAKGGWKSRDEPGYRTMLERVLACVPTLARHDVAGTCGGGKRCNCGCCWVRLLREERKKAGYGSKTAMHTSR